MKPCSCFTRINADLAKHGCQLEFNMLADPPRTLVATYVPPGMKKRGQRPPKVEATFCPFCGTKYPKDKGVASRLAPKPRIDPGKREAAEQSG